MKSINFSLILVFFLMLGCTSNKEFMVIGHRGAMGHEIHVRWGDTALREHVQHAGFKVRRGGVGFRGGDRHAIGPRLKRHEVSEGATHIGGNAQGFGHDVSLSDRARRKASAPGSFSASAAATRAGV